MFVAFFVAASFTSCKKDYVCACTATFDGGKETQAYPIVDQKKKDAKDACETLESTFKLLIDEDGATINCALD